MENTTTETLGSLIEDATVANLEAAEIPEVAEADKVSKDKKKGGRKSEKGVVDRTAKAPWKPSKYLHILVVTDGGVSNNNSGENEGNQKTLQKIQVGDDSRAFVSAAALRFGMRKSMQLKGLSLNRTFDPLEDKFYQQAPDFDAKTFVDDDLFGFMRMGKSDEGGSSLSDVKRPGAMRVTPAVSLSPFVGDNHFGAKAGVKDSTSLSSTELLHSRYAYTISLNIADLENPAHAAVVFDAIREIGYVGGNQARLLFDFGPESVVCRVTDDPCNRIQSVVELKDGIATCPKLINRIADGDVDPTEMFVGGELCEQLGVPRIGVKAALSQALEALAPSFVQEA